MYNKFYLFDVVDCIRIQVILVIWHVIGYNIANTHRLAPTLKALRIFLYSM